jgi:threonine-phosphate decarboxylase
MPNYKHGGNITAFSQEIGCELSEVIDLSSNINFIKPHINVDFNNLEIAPYPNYDKLENAIAKLYHIQKEELELFNGATTAIYSLFRELNLNHATLYSPCYLEYKKAAHAHNYSIDFINRFEDIDQEVKENSLVIFVNPSTPDGKFYDIEELMKKWIEKRCTLLIDESFLDFTPFESAIKYLKTYDKLYILKSMTKFYSSAGIRVGALLSNAKNIKAIKAKEPLWKISEFDSQYLQSALNDNSFVKKAKEVNDTHRKMLESLLKSSPLVEKVYPSRANYLLIKLKTINAIELQNRLLPYKIMIRNCSNFDGLNNHYVRIAVKDKSSIERLKEALTSPCYNS